MHATASPQNALCDPFGPATLKAVTFTSQHAESLSDPASLVYAVSPKGTWPVQQTDAQGSTLP